MHARIGALLVAFTLAVAGLATAQETTSGSIAGQVLDAQGLGVPGATVTITSEQGTKDYVTDAEGRFFAPFLQPGVYDARIQLSGFAPIEQRMIQVRLGQRVTLTDLTMRVGGLTETVQVQASAPVVDITSTTAGGVLNSDMLRSLPVGRNFTDTLYMVPGVSNSSGVGQANPSISGASGLENAYIVDGVNITNPGYGGVGSYSITFGSLGSGVTTEFIRETQVKTAGFEAEYGQATGGVVNVVTKSGTNVFRGSVLGYTKTGALEAGWKQMDSLNGTVNVTATTNWDAGVGGGGRIIRDRLFFYGTIDRLQETHTFTAPTGFPLASLGEVDRKRSTTSYAGKLTWQQSTAHRFDVSVFGDPSKGAQGPQRAASSTGNALLAADTGRFSELEYGTHSQTGRYDGILRNSWLLEGLISRSSNNTIEIPALQQHQYTDTTVTPNLRFGGLGAYDKEQPGTNVQLQLKSTNIVEAAGNHQIRYGVAYEEHRFHSRGGADRSAVYVAERDGHARRRLGHHPSRPDVWQDLPRDARQLRTVPEHDAGVLQLLPAGHVADGTTHVASRPPL